MCQYYPYLEFGVLHPPGNLANIYPKCDNGGLCFIVFSNNVIVMNHLVIIIMTGCVFDDNLKLNHLIFHKQHKFPHWNGPSEMV